MGQESENTSRDSRDEDDEDEYEEADSGKHLLGFMFGNVDNSGDLDVDYLDEDAKEHLAALADKLGSSLDLDLSVKSPETPSGAAEQDYEKKAEDAVNYEDIDEEYDGPEVQTATEEDLLLSKRDYFSKEAPLSTLENMGSVFDDENYDEDDDLQKEQKVEERRDQHETSTSAGFVHLEEKQPEMVLCKYVPDSGSLGSNLIEIPSKDAVDSAYLVTHNEDALVSEHVAADSKDLVEDEHLASGSNDALDAEHLAPELRDVIDSEDFAADLEDALREDEENLNTLGAPLCSSSPTPLPILCIEDGMVILRFSEIFGIHEPRKKKEKRDRRYSISKEKYKCMDITDIAEEDEEAILKRSSHNYYLATKGLGSPGDIYLSTDHEQDGSDLRVVQGTSNLTTEIGDQRKDSCHGAEPMKVDMPINLPADWHSPFSPKYCPLDQQDWENRIIWDNSPSLSNNSAETCEFSGPDDLLDDRKQDQEGKPEVLHKTFPREQRDKYHGLSVHGWPIYLEPFGSRKPPEETRYHPQLLRLESRLDTESSNDKDIRKDGAKDDIINNDVVRCFNNLTLQNRYILDGSWLDDIIWETSQRRDRPKRIFDLQDEQMLFEILDSKENHLQLHAGAMVIPCLGKPDHGDSFEHGHGGASSGRFNIANDKFYSNRKSSQQLKSHLKKRSAHGPKVLHSIPALKLQTMKAKLSNKDIANFHRPKALWYPHDIEVGLKEQGKLPMQGPMKIILKSLGGKGTKLHVDAEETVNSVKAKASKKLDFKLSEPVKIFYSGRELEDSKSLAAQDVRPNSLLHLVRSKIHLLPRAQKLPGENKSLRPPGAFKKKSDLSVKDGHVFLMEYSEERPLLLGNVGMGARLCTYYQKSGPGDQTGTLMRNENNGLGSVLPLDPADKSPFLGDIKPCYSQSSLETNLYRAPIFRHKVPSTDYLLVRSAKGKLSIRRIDRIDVVGQQEPHMEVISPGSKGVQTYIMNRLLVFLYREFRAVEKRGLRPFIRVDDLSSQFPSLAESFVRKRLKHCADLQRGQNGHLIWLMRRNFRIPLEEELRRMVTPENVCAYESMQAGLYRLKRLGITRLTHPTGLSSAMNQLPDEAITLAAASHIERELQITPWNLSSNFVACTNQDRENIERLEITGVGDPSGRGLGFSYVRTAPKAPTSNAVAKKKTVVGKGTTVTGTDADLRRLSMEAAREVLLKFNVPEEQIAKQTRWHRIALIRKLSSEQAASGVKVDPTTISKYARGQRMSFLQLQQQTREKCQEIWDRQVQSLCAVEGEENESDAEAPSDLDSFAGDLENLLDAEEGEEGEEGNYESKHDNADGFRGIKVRRRPFQAQAEEEIEDEAAEAAELCRMLMDDDEADRKKKKKVKTFTDKTGSLVSQPKLAFANADRVKTTNTVIKQISQPEGLYAAPKENIAVDKKEEENFSAKKIFPGKVKPKKKNDIEQLGLPKVKILGDGLKPDGLKIKEKKSARDSFVCGACGQLGHMRTNKNCPKYREDQETRVESADPEKTSGKPNSSDQAEQPQQKAPPKKLVHKGSTKIAIVEVQEDEKSSSKAKVLKVKCGSADRLPDKHTPSTSQNSEKPVTSDADTGNKPPVKVNKIIFSNKMKPEEVQVDSQRPSIVIKPPMEADSEHLRKKIIIKRPKDIINVDEISQEGSTEPEYRKTRKINELTGLEKQLEQESRYYSEETVMRLRREEKQWWQEESRRKYNDRQREERARRAYEEQERLLEGQDRLAEIRRYEETIRREREEEERQKAKKKKKKKKKHVIGNDYLDDLPPRRNDRRILERERTVKRRLPESAKDSALYGSATKRRRGGEVVLSNILEGIVETLRNRHDISYLFLKPVSKKEAPDYFDVIEHPMDLSTIRDKVRKLQYKSREEFRHDVFQIAFNAHKYNDTRYPRIPPLADQLLELCDYLLDEHDVQLTEAESGIEYLDS